MIEFGWGDFEETYRVISFKGKWMLGQRPRSKRRGFRAIFMNIMGIITSTIANKPQNSGQIIYSPYAHLISK